MRKNLVVHIAIGTVFGIIGTLVWFSGSSEGASALPLFIIGGLIIGLIVGLISGALSKEVGPQKMKILVYVINSIISFFLSFSDLSILGQLSGLQRVAC